ncbi:MAG TPA: type II toxin-antitoxin system HigB family toxin [Burkholderiales bacterium]|jgi:mRNA interferase HigB
MRIAGRELLGLFCDKHADVRAWIERWLADVELAAWTKPGDIRSQYASASFLADGIVIFNVKGNAYRLEVVVAYRTGIVSIL